jgi:hypothetical protein
MLEYGFRYTVEFKGEEIEQLIITSNKESAQKAFDYHIQIAEKNPDKIRIISTGVEEIAEKSIMKDEIEVPTSTATH